MAWSKVDYKHRKPFKWWYHKILCEYGWIIRHKDSYKTYHYHLLKCCETGFNLYGKII